MDEADFVVRSAHHAPATQSITSSVTAHRHERARSECWCNCDGCQTLCYATRAQPARQNRTVESKHTTDQAQPRLNPTGTDVVAWTLSPLVVG